MSIFAQKIIFKNLVFLHFVPLFLYHLYAAQKANTIKESSFSLTYHLHAAKKANTIKELSFSLNYSAI